MTLIGRQTELARIGSMLDDAGVGVSGALALIGDAGIGKTTLCDAAVESARERGMTVLRARAVEAEAELAFAGLAELLAPVADAVARLEPPHDRLLAEALGRVAALDGAPPQAPFAAAVALLRLLEMLGARSPAGVLLVLDDVHWLDEATLEAVCFAARRLHADGVAVLVAGRTEPDRGLRARGLPLLELAPLAQQEAERLLAATGGADLAAAPRRRLLAAAQGNPLALVELARALTFAQRQGTVELTEPIRPSGAIEQAFRAQLAELPPATARALVVAAADEGLPYGRVADALRRSGADPDALAPAERTGLLVADGGRLRFRHPLLRAVVYHGAPFPERAAAHAALAATLAAAEPGGEDAIRRAWHLAAATDGPDEAAAAALEAAGALERARGAAGDAARTLERAAELTPDPVAAAGRALAAANEFATAGETARALALAERALEQDGVDERVQVELQFLRGVMTVRSGALDAGSEMVGAAAERAAAAGHPDRAADLLMHRSLRHRIVGDYAAMRRDASRAGELARSVPPGDAAGVREERIALAHLLEIVVLANEGRLAEADAIVERHAELLVRIAPDHPYQEVVATPAHVSVWSEQWERAERILLRMVDGARARNAVTAVIYPLAVHSQLELRRGRVGQAHAEAGEALELALDTRQHSLAAFAAGMHAAVEAVRGEEEACRERAAQSIALCDAIGATAMGMWPRAALGHLELALGRPEEALGPLSACARAAERIGMRQPGVVQWSADYVEALVRAGREQEARAALGLLREGSPTGWSVGTLARCRGLLTPGEEGEQLLARSAEALERAGARVEAARSLLCLGERLRRGRQRRAAREPLQAAIDVFEGAGARPWSARARDELRATGQQSRPRDVSREELTPHEHRVALLVAAGRTNPEVAAELYVTRKTVEHHLSQIYRKLGLRSRTELARELAGELPPRSVAA